nr:heavy metal translocating P-type ATPase [Actinomycetota bacterium]
METRTEPRQDAHHGHDLGGPPGHGDHGSHGGNGDHAAMFRSRFWLTLALSLPVVFFSRMFQDLLGYEAPTFPGSRWIPAVLGTAVFLYGGWPFLAGAISEIRSRRPGMMLLIGLAISVAFAASWATEIGVVDLDFWWELAALIAVMLLGHWQEMRAIGQASGALEALAELLPDEAELVMDEGVRTVPLHELHPGDVVLVRSGGRVPADGVIMDGTADLDESMI